MRTRHSEKSKRTTPSKYLMGFIASSASNFGAWDEKAKKKEWVSHKILIFRSHRALRDNFLCIRISPVLMYILSIQTLGWSKALCAWRPNVWRMPWSSMWREIRAIFLRQCHVPSVLLWAVLVDHTLEGWARVSQATGQRRRRPTTQLALQMVNTAQSHSEFI